MSSLDVRAAYGRKAQSGIDFYQLKGRARGSVITIDNTTTLHGGVGGRSALFPSAFSMEKTMLTRLTLWTSLVLATVCGAGFVLLVGAMIFLDLPPKLKNDAVVRALLWVLPITLPLMAVFHGIYYQLTRRQLDREDRRKEELLTAKKVLPYSPSVDMKSLGLSWPNEGLPTVYQIQLWSSLKAEIERQVTYKLKPGETPDYPTMANAIVHRTGLAAFLAPEVRKAVEETLTRFLAARDSDMAFKFVQAVVGNL